MFLLGFLPICLTLLLSGSAWANPLTDSTSSLLLNRVLTKLTDLESLVGETELEARKAFKGEEEDSLSEDEEEELDRHAVLSTLADGQIVAAHLETQECSGQVGNWIVDVEERSAAATTGGFTTGGVFTAAVSGYYYFQTCFMCGQIGTTTQICDMSIFIGGARIVSFGERNNVVTREQTFCQSLIYQMAAGTTLYITEEAGGPNNCKRSSSAFRYSQFNAFLIEGVF